MYILLHSVIYVYTSMTIYMCIHIDMTIYIYVYIGMTMYICIYKVTYVSDF